MREILEGDRLVRHIEWTNGILVVVVSLGAWIWFSGASAFGVLLGGLISTLSFQALKWQLRRAFGNSERLPRKGGLFASYYLRFLAVLFVVYTVIYYGWANPIALLVGLSLVVLSISVVGAHEFLLMFVKKGER